MGKNIFISYKYKDTNVRSLKDALSEYYEPTKVRDYVDRLQTRLSNIGNINLGEKDGEDLSAFSDETIASKLRDKIFHSSLTIVLISKGMKDPNLPETEQWIPWEISYSLKEVQREDKISRTNAILAIVIPDKTFNPYSYFITENHCSNTCHCTIYNTNVLFKILRKNLFNKNNIYGKSCINSFTIYNTISPSYIHIVKWDEFMQDISKHINIAYSINENISNYDIKKIV